MNSQTYPSKQLRASDVKFINYILNTLYDTYDDISDFESDASEGNPIESSLYM